MNDDAHSIFAASFSWLLPLAKFAAAKPQALIVRLLICWIIRINVGMRAILYAVDWMNMNYDPKSRSNPLTNRCHHSIDVVFLCHMSLQLKILVNTKWMRFTQPTTNCAHQFKLMFHESSNTREINHGCIKVHVDLLHRMKFRAWILWQNHIIDRHICINSVEIIGQVVLNTSL